MTNDDEDLCIIDAIEQMMVAVNLRVGERLLVVFFFFFEEKFLQGIRSTVVR